MSAPKSSALIAIVALFLPLAAQAGAPDNPGEKGKMVNRDKDYWQDRRGNANAWGDIVSDVAISQDGGNNETNLGGFLSSGAGGPNPANDNGSGND